MGAGPPGGHRALRVGRRGGHGQGAPGPGSAGLASAKRRRRCADRSAFRPHCSRRQISRHLTFEPAADTLAKRLERISPAWEIGLPSLLTVRSVISQQGPMSSHVRRRMDPELRRQQILDEAIRLIGQLGYQGFTVQELALRCSLTKGGLLHYFGSKEQLLVAILEE